MPCEPAIAAPLIEAGSVLGQNLKRLTDPALAGRIAGRSTRLARLARHPEGGRVLRLGGHDLTGPRPELEAEAWAASRSSLEGSDRIVVVGLGLGHHLRAIRRRSAAPILVLEPSLEVLRLALAQQPLDLGRLWIVDSPAALRDHLAAHLTLREQVSVHVLPAYERLFPELCQAAHAAVRRGVELAAVTGNTLELRASVWAEHLAANLPELVGRVPATALSGWLAGRPAILCAAGPSLDRNVGELRHVAGRAAIVAVNTSLAALERAGVRADLMVALEAVDVSSQLDGLELNRACPRVLDLTSHPALLAGAPAEVIPFASQIPFFQSLTAAIGLGPGLPIGGSAANAALALLHLAGADPIILCGQDLAYSEDRVYASGTCFGAMRARHADGVIELSGLEAKRRLAAPRPEVDTTVERKGAVLAEAYGGGQVWTSLDFNYFRHHFEHFAEETRGLRLINATEGGARIRGYREQPLAEVVDQLAPGQLPPLPTSPRIDPDRIVAALRGEHRAAAAAIQAAREAAGSDLRRLREAIAGSVLLQAHGHQAIQAATRTGDLGTFCAAIVEMAGRVLADTERALARLGKKERLKFSR